jgi:hypothetical protein
MLKVTLLAWLSEGCALTAILITLRVVTMAPETIIFSIEE